MYCASKPQANGSVPSRFWHRLLRLPLRHGLPCSQKRIHGFQHARGAAVRAVCTSVPGADSSGKSGVPCKREKARNRIDFRNEKASWMGAFFIWKYLQIKTNVLS